MDPNEVIRPQTEQTVWIYGSGHKNEGQVAQPNEKGAFPVIRTTVYRRDGRVQVWQRSPDQGPEFGVLMPDLSSVDDKIAAEFQRAQDKAESGAATRRETRTYTGTDPQTGRPAKVTEYESGPPKYDEIKPEAADDPTTPAAQEAARIRDEKWWNQNTPPNPANPRAGGSGRAETHTERLDRERKEQPVSAQGAVPGYPGWTQRTQKDASGELTLYYPPGSTTPQTSLPEKPEAPTKPTYQPVKGGDGQDYIRSITIGPDGKPVIQAYGPNGQPVAAIPGEKEPPKLTQTRGDDGQVYTTVTTIGADNKVTVQTVDQQGKPVEKIPTKAPARERLQDPDTKQWLEKGDDGKWRPIQIEGQEGTGNQGPSLPHVVLGQMKDGLTTFREDLTRQVGAGTLTPAVAERRWKEATDIAEFGIRESSLLQQDEISRRSSDVSLRTNAMSNGTAVFNNALDFIAKINPTLKVGSTAGARAFREILQMHQNQMESLGAYRNEFSGAGAPRGAPPRGAAVAASVPGVGAPPSPGGITNTTDAGGVPREYTPASSTNGATGLPPAAAQDAQSRQVLNAPAAPPLPASPASLIAGPGGAPAVDTGNVGISPDGSAAVAPDGTTAPVDVNRPLPTLDPNAAPPVGMAPTDGPDIGVLSAYQPMTPPVAPPPMTAPTMDSGPLPGVLRAQQIASTPPWRLSNEDLAWAHQNGLLDHAMAVPGVGA